MLTPMLVLAGDIAPTVSYIGPSTVSPGDTVYVYGTNFDQHTFIGLDGNYGTAIQPTSINLISPTSLSFTVPSLGIGSHTLAVAEKAGPWPLSNSVNMTVVAARQAPTISTISPSTASVGTKVFVYGTNFMEHTYAYLDGPTGLTLDTTYVSPTTLRFTIPSTVSLGQHKLFVNEKVNGWPTSNYVLLNVVNNTSVEPVPVINPVAPLPIADNNQARIRELQVLLTQLLQQLISLLQAQQR